MRLNHVAIIGAGLVGRVLALSLLKRQPDIRIDFYDTDTDLCGSSSCGHAAGGMVAPWSELATNEPALYAMGLKSLALWPQLLQCLPQQSPIFQQHGTLIVAHPGDGNDLDFLAARIKQHSGDDNAIDKQHLALLEPQLRSEKFYQRALYFSAEAHIQVEQFYQQSNQFFTDNKSIHYQTIANDDFPQSDNYDHLFDSRGLGARKAVTNLFGVRGEAIIVHAPAVTLNRCLRLVHPRHAIYIIPRGNHHYYVGATTIDSDDDSPISVKSLLDLTSTLYFIHEGFAEARLVNTISHCRPTLPGALPQIERDGNISRINGFYRHGYLLAPAICQHLLQQFPINKNYPLEATLP